MKLYFVVLLGIWIMLGGCKTEGNSNNETVKTKLHFPENTNLHQACENSIIQAIKKQIATATPAQLTDLLYFCASNCSLTEEAETHAILVKCLDKHLEVMLEILDSKADSQWKHIIKLLNTPATQALPQRNILLQLKEKNVKTTMARKVQAALQESVDKGDETLRKLINDRTHTYQ